MSSGFGGLESTSAISMEPVSVETNIVRVKRHYNSCTETAFHIWQDLPMPAPVFRINGGGTPADLPAASAESQ
jgi:hypothetical protein